MLVIPGNVGYLKQFFSAQLFVANGAPVGSGLVVRDIRAASSCPQARPGAGHRRRPAGAARNRARPAARDAAGAGGRRGRRARHSRRRVGASPRRAGQAEFLIRGEREGYHTIDFDIRALLEGLPGRARPRHGLGKWRRARPQSVLRRDLHRPVGRAPRRAVPVPGHRHEHGQGMGNDVNVTLDQSRMSGARS